MKMSLNTFSLPVAKDSYETEKQIDSLMQPSANLENFYVCNLDDIIEKHARWLKLMPRIKPYYAVKCNSHPSVLEILAALNTGFDCASKIEMESVLKLGVEPKRIIYAHPVKIISHIQYAASKEILYNTFDSKVELYKCKKYYPNAKMILRIKRDASSALISFGAKFGCDPYEEAPELLNTAKKLQLNVVGVAFHVGSYCSDITAFRKAIQDAKFVFDYADSLGFQFNLLDIGGGFPGNKNSSFSVFADIINSAIEDYFPNPSVKIVAEPGTYFVRSAFTLYCSIQGINHQIKKDVKTEKQQSEYMYYIPEGVYHSFSRVGYSLEKVCPILLKKITDGILYKTTIWGQTLDSYDKIADDIYLPKAELGDWLMFENMGDYSIAVSTSFNGFLAPDVFLSATTNTLSFLEDKIPQLLSPKNKLKLKRIQNSAKQDS